MRRNALAGTDFERNLMSISALESLVKTGTKLWLDSVDPDAVTANRRLGATGATSNPVIVTDLIKTGRFDGDIIRLMERGLSDEQIAWAMTDLLVSGAQEVFAPVWQTSAGNDGYVSFELDPLIEDAGAGLPHAERVRQYVQLGKKWSQGHTNRMIKVPATPAGLEALEELAASGVQLNVTLIFTPRQYRQAREQIWRGAQRRDNLRLFKSVYSIFVSRVDAYTQKQVPQLSSAAQGQVGITNAKKIWRENQSFWPDKELPLQQEIVFASTGVKDPAEDPCKYVKAFAGSDIQTNPPATNQAVQQSGYRVSRQIDVMPPAEIVREIDEKVDLDAMEKVLMAEGIEKFVSPQRLLLSLIADRRKVLV
jgi:transaldolase